MSMCIYIATTEICTELKIEYPKINSEVKMRTNTYNLKRKRAQLLVKEPRILMEKTNKILVEKYLNK
jgi:hypothetical protein